MNLIISQPQMIPNKHHYTPNMSYLYLMFKTTPNGPLIVRNGDPGRGPCDWKVASGSSALGENDESTWNVNGLI